MIKRTFSQRDERVFPVSLDRAFACALSFDTYRDWWNARFKVEASQTDQVVGSRVEFSPAPLVRAGWEITEVSEHESIGIKYHRGWHTGTGAWRFKAIPQGTLVSYEMQIQPRNAGVAVLYQLARVEQRHSDDIQGLFDRMLDHLKAQDKV